MVSEYEGRSIRSRIGRHNVELRENDMEKASVISALVDYGIDETGKRGDKVLRLLFGNYYQSQVEIMVR